LIDTHCHLDSSRFDEDREEVLNRATQAGVTGIIVPGIGPENWEPLLEWTGKDSRISVGLGIHPQLLPHLTAIEEARALGLLDTLLARGGALAVGECGLDGPSLEGAPLERQLRVLREHLRLARKYDLPVLMHCHRLHPALIDLFTDEPPNGLRVLMHSYSGGVDLAKRYVRWGCSFSFAGPISYEGARKPVAALRELPPDRLMLETDAPDQAPTPFRGQRSEPAYLAQIVEATARVLGRSTDEVSAQTTANARAFFKRDFSLR